MSTTSNGFRYPEPSDPPQMDQDIKKLAQDVDSKTVLKTGSTMTGALTLPGSDPTSTNHATRKAYVDSLAVGSREATKDIGYRSWTTGSSSSKSWTVPGTASSNPCWMENYANPYSGRKYIAQVTYNALLWYGEDVTLSLRIHQYNSTSGSYNDTTLNFLGTYAGSGVDMPLSMTCTASIPANVGFSVKFEVYASHRGSLNTTFPPRGGLKDQTINVTVHPGTNLGSSWP
jgi:hypothetical protein